MVLLGKYFTAFATFQIEGVKQSSTSDSRPGEVCNMHILASCLPILSSLAATFQVFPTLCYAWRGKKTHPMWKMWNSSASMNAIV